MVDGSTDAVWRKEVPFGGRIDHNSYFGGSFATKTPQKIAANRKSQPKVDNRNKSKTVKDTAKVTIEL